MSATLKLPPAFELVALETVDSTNDYAKNLAQNGARDGTIVWAKQQTDGRGRRGRKWVSILGNLYFSLVSRPGCDLKEASNLSFLTALAICDAIEIIGGPFAPRVQCKWPNDVLVDGKKVAGILLECHSDSQNRADWLVIGVGVNISHHPEDTQYPATALSEWGQGGYTAENMLEAFAQQFAIWFDRWREFGFDTVRQAWVNRARGIGKPITARLPDRVLEGIFTGMDNNGALILQTEDGEKHITAADVFFPLRGQDIPDDIDY